VGLLACGLAVEHERGMGKPLGGSGRGGIGRRGRPAVTGGSVRRRNDGARGSSPWGGLRPTALGATGAGEGGEAHRSAVGAGVAAERGSRRRPAEETGRCSWAGGSREARAPVAARIGRGRSCGGGRGVMEAWGSPAARNFGGGGLTRGGAPGEIRTKERPEVTGEGLRSSGVTRRC
jgi:hypothetical protein